MIIIMLRQFKIEEENLEIMFMLILITQKGISSNIIFHNKLNKRAQKE